MPPNIHPRRALTLSMGATMAETAEAIIERIRAAFAGVPRGQITIHEAEVIDNYGSDAERQEARLLDTEASWDRIADQDIEECMNSLCHLDPVGWRYSIPAYMIWSLQHDCDRDSMVVDSTIYTFDLCSSYPRLLEYQLERFRLLNQAQSRAVCQFLRYMASIDDHVVDARMAGKALDEFWGGFCERSVL